MPALNTWRCDTTGEPDPLRRLRRAYRCMVAGDMIYGLVRADALARVGTYRSVLVPDRLLLSELALLGEFVQVPRVLWERRFVGLADLERQKRAFWPDGAPASTRAPWWVTHAALVGWERGVLGTAREPRRRRAARARAAARGRAPARAAPRAARPPARRRRARATGPRGVRAATGAGRHPAPCAARAGRHASSCSNACSRSRSKSGRDDPSASPADSTLMPLLLQVPDAWRPQARSPAAAWASRAAVVLGGVVILGSMLLQWGFDRSVEPNVALNAWEQYPRADLALAFVGILVVASGALPWRPIGIAARAGASLLAVAFILWLMRADPGVGARVALLGAVLALAGAAAAFAADPSLWPRLRARVDSTPGARRVVRVVTSSWLLGAVIGVVTFPLKTLEPGGGTDSSWVAALHLAADRGLDFGTDIVFTYGPLGFLTVPRLQFVWTAALGVAYMLAVQVALATTMIAASRRAFPLIVAVGIAGLACAAVGETTPVAVAGIVFCGCVAALNAPDFAHSRWWLPRWPAPGCSRPCRRSSSSTAG